MSGYLEATGLVSPIQVQAHVLAIRQASMENFARVLQVARPRLPASHAGGTRGRLNVYA